MNYITELNNFYDWIETNSISTHAILLWYALMHIDNKTGWKEEFTVAILVLKNKTGLTHVQICTARNQLANHGRLQWNSRGGNLSASYKIIPFGDANIYTK